jgi:hypothetical protein
MKVVVSALIALSLVLVVGCDKNDENTVNPIDKFHYTYPIFHLKIDNDFRTFGIDSLQLTVSPSIGWPGPVYSDANGFLGTSAGGTFVDYIDTINTPDSIVYDTHWVVFGFSPSQTYTFDFSRSEPFIWLDSFRADYAITVDSLWVLFSADTIEATKNLDPAHPPETLLYRVVANPAPSLTPQPDDTVFQSLLLGYWFDTARVIANPDDTVKYPPDSTRDSTVLWGLWHRIDSFFLPPDSNIWCDLDSMVIVAETLYDQFEFPSIVIDSVYYYGNCNPTIDTVQERIYRQYGWGVYPGGDQSEPPIPSFDTTLHFFFPDTTKKLFVNPDGLTIQTPVAINPETDDTTWQTLNASIELIYQGVSTQQDNLIIDLTMPPVEVFPHYQFIIREVPQP